MTEEKQDGPTELREARDRAVADATAARAELTQFKAATLFDKAGLGEKQAALFLKANPEVEITEAAVSEFIDEYGFKVETGEPDPAPKPVESADPPPDAGLGTFTKAAEGGTSGGAPAAQPKMSTADFEKLLATNPDEAVKAYAEGRAPRNEANVQARELVSKGIIDH